MVLKLRVSGIFIVSNNFEVDQVHKGIQKKPIDVQRESLIKETLLTFGCEVYIQGDTKKRELLKKPNKN